MHLYSIYPSICNWRMTVAFSVATIPRGPPESKFTCNVGGPRRIGWCDRYSGVTPLQRRRPLGRQVWSGQGCGEDVEKSGTHIDHVATCNFPLSDNSRPACDEYTIGMVGTDHGRPLFHNGTSIRDRDDGDSGIQPLEYHAFREAPIGDLAGSRHWRASFDTQARRRVPRRCDGVRTRRHVGAVRIRPLLTGKFTGKSSDSALVRCNLKQING